jgi:hypothetical protein
MVYGLELLVGCRTTGVETSTIGKNDFWSLGAVFYRGLFTPFDRGSIPGKAPPQEKQRASELI